MTDSEAIHLLHSIIADLWRQNAELRQAMSELIPWVGEARGGPAWGTEEAKASNAEMCDSAFSKAVAMFPENYNGRAEPLPIQN
jgi:hypothetical protein